MYLWRKEEWGLSYPYHKPAIAFDDKVDNGSTRGQLEPGTQWQAHSEHVGWIQVPSIEGTPFDDNQHGTAGQLH